MKTGGPNKTHLLLIEYKLCVYTIPVDDSSDTDEEPHLVLHERAVGWNLGQIEQGL